MDLGYARAANVHGTGRHSNVFSYLAGPVFYPSRHRNFDTYIHALVGAARVSGPVPRNGGGFLLGHGRGAMPGQLAAELTIGFYIPWPFALAWII